MHCRNAAKHTRRHHPSGGVAEWLNAAVSKTVLPVLLVTRVRIPPPPPEKTAGRESPACFFINDFSLARAQPRRGNCPLCGWTTTCFAKPSSRRILTIVQAVKNPRRRGGGRLWLALLNKIRHATRPTSEVPYVARCFTAFINDMPILRSNRAILFGFREVGAVYLAISKCFT